MGTINTSDEILFEAGDSQEVNGSNREERRQKKEAREETKGTLVHFLISFLLI